MCDHPPPPYTHDDKLPPPYTEDDKLPPVFTEDPMKKENKLQTIYNKYEINEWWAKKLNLLSNVRVKVAIDTSGSMSEKVKHGTKEITRFEELHARLNILIELVCLLNKSGIDVYPFNSPKILNVTSPKQVEHIFAHGPAGDTPLNKTLQQMLLDCKDYYNQKVLIILATDGEPSDGIANLYNTLNTRHPIDEIYVTFLACTDDEATMDYLNQWDKTIKHLDVCDDYFSERDEIRRIQGPTFPFSQGDYVVKCLVGSLDPSLDRMDEKVSTHKPMHVRDINGATSITHHNGTQYTPQDGCCIIL